MNLTLDVAFQVFGELNCHCLFSCCDQITAFGVCQDTCEKEANHSRKVFGEEFLVWDLVMTEMDWLNRTQLVAMLRHVKKTGCPDRKLQLASVAFCRLLAHLPFPQEWQKTLASFEEWLEGATLAEEVLEAKQQLDGLSDFPLSIEPDQSTLSRHERFYGFRAVHFLVATGQLEPPVPLLGRLSQFNAAHIVAFNTNATFGKGQERKVRAAQCRLVRDIFGNPFRPVAFDPAWRTSTAVALAQGMYESRDFSAMPILADALQDAGCEEESLLRHCRDAEQVHVRGCWVVDLVLNRK